MELIHKLMLTGLPLMFVGGMILKYSTEGSRAFWISGSVFVAIMLGEVVALMYLVWR